MTRTAELKVEPEGTRQENGINYCKKVVMRTRKRYVGGNQGGKRAERASTRKEKKALRS